MNYKISDLANIFEVTTESIRFFEKKGIISPKRDEETGYRIYSGWDAFSLLDWTMYKKCEFSLQEYLTLTNTDSLSICCNMFDNKLVEIETKIERLTMLKDWLSFWSSELLDFSLNLNKVRLRRMPEMVFIPVGTEHAGDDLENYVIDNDAMKLHASLLPFCLPVIQTSVASLYNEKGNAKIYRGGIINKSYLEKMNADLSAVEPVTIPSSLFLSYNVCVGDIGGLDLSELYPIIDYLNESKYTAYNEVYGLVMARIKEGSVYKRYFQFLLPVKKYI